MTATEQTKTPTVSVVMCTYNGGRYLAEQMDSILAQDYPLLEIIVQDDCSTDDTWDLLEMYQRNHPGFVKAHRNAERLGFNRNFHTAMLRATGEFIAISDQDDVWFAEKISRQVEAIGQADVCYSDYYRDRMRTPHMHERIVPPADMVSLLFSNTIPGHTLLIRRTFLQREEAWNDGFYYDWWFLVTAQLCGNGVAHAARPLNWHRPHNGSAIARLRAEKGWRTAARPTWQPYVMGWHDLHRMRKLPAWQQFYTFIARHTSAQKEPLAHRLCTALLSPLQTPRLCWLCLRHRREVYPSCSGWKQMLRAFCRPAIYAYGNTAFCI